MVHKRNASSKPKVLRGIHKYKAEIQEIKKRGFIKEDEVFRMRMRLNKGSITYGDTEILNDIKITPEQTRKGLKWLMNKWKTPRGVERKNNPFGYREQSALETFKEFRLNSFTDNINYAMKEAGIHNWIPVWDVFGKDGYFQYIMEGGEPKIIG